MNNDTIFTATINITTLMETELLPLKVALKIGLNFDDTDPYHQAIALERVRFILNISFGDSIFVSRKNKLLPQLKELTSTPIVECWDEPWDQFIALMVYYKISAVLDDKGHIEFLNISGDSISEDLEYTYYADMLNSDITEGDLEWMKEKDIKTLWYHRADTSINENNDPSEMSWDMLGLVWDKPPMRPDPIGAKNNIKQFTPKIIK